MYFRYLHNFIRFSIDTRLVIGYYSPFFFNPEGIFLSTTRWFVYGNQIMKSLRVTYFYMHFWIDFFFFFEQKKSSSLTFGFFFVLYFFILFWELRWDQYSLLLHTKLNFPLFSHVFLLSSLYVSHLLSYTNKFIATKKCY